MIDKESRMNRRAFEDKYEAVKKEFLPRKYFEKFVNGKGSDYDHAILYRNKEHDYLVVSLYGTSTSHQRMMDEGFQEIPSMYNTSCRSYFKRFLNTKSSKVKETCFENNIC